MSDPIKRPKPGISPKTVNEDWSRYENDEKAWAEKEKAFRDELRNGGVSRGWY